MKKEPVTNKSTKKINEPTERIVNHKQRGIVNAGLLINTASLATAVFAVWPWMSTPKLPPSAGD